MNEAKAWAQNHNHLPMPAVLLRQRIRGMTGAGSGIRWSCLTGGVFYLDILRCVGGTCGNVSCMLPWLRVAPVPN